jgi:hypothetical protein
VARPPWFLREGRTPERGGNQLGEQVPPPGDSHDRCAWPGLFLLRRAVRTRWWKRPVRAARALRRLPVPGRQRLAGGGARRRGRRAHPSRPNSRGPNTAACSRLTAPSPSAFPVGDRSVSRAPASTGGTPRPSTSRIRPNCQPASRWASTRTRSRHSTRAESGRHRRPLTIFEHTYDSLPRCG